MSATSPTGPRNVTTNKYVLTSAQAKNVDSRPPFPNSANDNGASDVDISHQEVGDDLGNGGELAEIQEEEEGEMSREMLIAMAELTFDWLKPPEKKKKQPNISEFQLKVVDVQVLNTTFHSIKQNKKMIIYLIKQ